MRPVRSRSARRAPLHWQVATITAAVRLSHSGCHGKHFRVCATKQNGPAPHRRRPSSARARAGCRGCWLCPERSFLGKAPWPCARCRWTETETGRLSCDAALCLPPSDSVARLAGASAGSRLLRALGAARGCSDAGWLSAAGAPSPHHRSPTAAHAHSTRRAVAARARRRAPHLRPPRVRRC